MHAVDLIAQAVKDQAPELPYEPIKEICAVTGANCLCVKKSDVISDAFTNNDILACPQSEYVGINVWYAWNYGYKTRDDAKRLKCPERMSCWICDGNIFKEINRQEIRDYVLNGVDFDVWSAYITTSYKKHGSLWAKVNRGTRGVWRFEMIDVDCRNKDKVLEFWNILNDAVHHGIGRSIIENLNPDPYVINKIGLKIWSKFELWARQIYKSPLYQFLAYLLPSAEELKKEKELCGEKEPDQKEIVVDCNSENDQLSLW